MRHTQVRQQETMKFSSGTNPQVLLLLLLGSFCCSLSSAHGALDPRIQADPCGNLLDPIDPCTCTESVLNCTEVQSAEEFLTIPGLQNGQSLGFDTIRVGGSVVEEIPTGAFGNHYATRLYDFSGNAELRSIAPSAFSPLGVDTLETIIVAGNPSLASFPFQAVRNYRALRTLILDSNAIESVPPAALKGASPLLEEIYIRGNQVAAIGADAFYNLPGLIQIGLQSNRLTTLAADSLAFTSRPETVYLQGNSIRTFERHFATLLPTYSLGLEGNPFNDIDRETWEPLLVDLLEVADGETYGHVNISPGQSFDCGCRHKWLYDNKDFRNVISVYCYYPGPPGYKSIWDVDESVFADC